MRTRGFWSKGGAQRRFLQRDAFHALHKASVLTPFSANPPVSADVIVSANSPASPIVAAPSASASTASADATQVAKPAYPASAATPTQTAARGIRFDFNQGARVLMPERADGGEWAGFWQNLREGYDMFGRDHVPQDAHSGGGRYVFR